MNITHIYKTPDGPIIITKLDAASCEALGVGTESLTLSRLGFGVALVETIDTRKTIRLDVCEKKLGLSRYSARQVVDHVYAVDPLRKD